jgi:hypothetical protein
MQLKILPIVIIVLIPLLMGSSCQRRAAIERVRDVHSVIVAGYQTTDRIIAPLFDEAGDRCIATAREQGLTGLDARDHARHCMRHWYVVENVLSISRASLAELELIYTDIENGEDRFSDWQSIATRLLSHGNRLIEILTEIGVEVPEDLRNAINMICQMVDCEA